MSEPAGLEPSPTPAPHEEALRTRFGDAVGEVSTSVDFPTYTVDPGQIVPICRFVKEELGFRLPALLIGVGGESVRVAGWPGPAP